MWYAVWVRTGQEQKVLDLCVEKIEDREAFEECFLPKYEKPRKVNGQWVKREEILFPGYLFFVAENPERLQGALRGIPEFAKVLGDEDGAIPLYEEEVEFLQKHINEKKVFEMSVGEIVGEKLVILEGPMMGLEGKVVYVDRHKRCAVLEVEFFGRVVKMKVGLEIVGKREIA